MRSAIAQIESMTKPLHILALLALFAMAPIGHAQSADPAHLDWQFEFGSCFSNLSTADLAAKARSVGIQLSEHGPRYWLRITDSIESSYSLPKQQAANDPKKRAAVDKKIASDEAAAKAKFDIERTALTLEGDGLRTELLKRIRARVPEDDEPEKQFRTKQFDYALTGGYLLRLADRLEAGK